jgi:hypothetical protein
MNEIHHQQPEQCGKRRIIKVPQQKINQGNDENVL